MNEGLGDTKDIRIILVRRLVYAPYVDWELGWVRVKLKDVRDRIGQWMM